MKVFIFIIISLSSLRLLASIGTTAEKNSSVSSALGGAGVAAVSAGDISSLNPASLVFLFGYNFYSKYQPGEMAIGISDNTMDAAVPAAVYTYQKKDFKNFKLTFAEPLAKRVALGVSLSYYQIMQNQKSSNLASADVGLTYLLRSNKALALVLYDVNKSPDTWPEDFQVHSKIGLGYHYVYKGFLRTRIDYLSGKNFQFNSGSWMLGVENYLNRWTIVRLGYQENSNNINDLYTIGLGFDLPKFKLNYAYLTETIDNSQVRHSVDLTVPF